MTSSSSRVPPGAGPIPARTHARTRANIGWGRTASGARDNDAPGLALEVGNDQTAPEAFYGAHRFDEFVRRAGVSDGVTAARLGEPRAWTRLRTPWYEARGAGSSSPSERARSRAGVGS